MARQRKKGLAKRLLRAITGRARQPVRDRDPADEGFRRIWAHLKATQGPGRPPRRKRQTVLVLQMGKVASMAIRSALVRHGLNAFHTHAISPSAQRSMIDRLSGGALTLKLIAYELRYQLHDTALYMLVRWYQEHKRYAGRKLKVITLTRDPATHFKSWLIQHFDDRLPLICAWQGDRLGEQAAAADPAMAVRDFVQEVADIIVTVGADKPDGCAALAEERWPRHPVFAAEVYHWLWPINWFDREITGLFGFDVLAAPTFRNEGWAVLSNDWVDVLVLRFEQLAALQPRIAAFVEVPDLVLPRRNVTANKEDAALYLPVIEAALDTPTGRDLIAALRASPYARACGYDRAE